LEVNAGEMEQQQHLHSQNCAGLYLDRGASRGQEDDGSMKKSLRMANGKSGKSRRCRRLSSKNPTEGGHKEERLTETDILTDGDVPANKNIFSFDV
jgi:hypothetical protein